MSLNNCARSCRTSSVKQQHLDWGRPNQSGPLMMPRETCCICTRRRNSTRARSDGGGARPPCLSLAVRAELDFEGLVRHVRRPLAAKRRMGRGRSRSQCIKGLRLAVPHWHTGAGDGRMVEANVVPSGGGNPMRTANERRRAFESETVIPGASALRKAPVSPSDPRHILASRRAVGVSIGDILRASGIEVTDGICADNPKPKARQKNGNIHRRRLRRPRHQNPNLVKRRP